MIVSLPLLLVAVVLAVVGVAQGSGPLLVGSILASLLYLQTQQEADGSIAGPSGSYADSELFAIAAAAAGYDPRALTAASGVSVMSYLAANVAGACPMAPADPGTSAGAGDCGELIQAVEAAGEDPTAFGGVDLVSLLGGYYDPATGEYGDGEAFTQVLAVQGLVAAGVLQATVPRWSVHANARTRVAAGLTPEGRPAESRSP